MEPNEQQVPEKQKSKPRMVIGGILLLIAIGLFITGVIMSGWKAIAALVAAIGLGWLALMIL